MGTARRETWGTELYGDPCRDCGFGWTLAPAQAVDVVAGLPDRFDDVLRDASGDERIPLLGWTAGGYVCHVVDNLRIWSERMSGARLTGVAAVGAYDPDALAAARRYDDVNLRGALWSLRWAAVAWVDAARAALADGVVLEHSTRGTQRAEDVARANAHDAVHHLWDIDRILAGDGTGRPAR